MVSEDRRVRRSWASCGLSLETWGAEAWDGDVPIHVPDQGPAQQSDRETESNCLHFHSAQVLHGSEAGSSTSGTIVCFIQSTNSNAGLPETPLTLTHPRKCCTSDLDTPWPRWTGHWALTFRCFAASSFTSWNAPKISWARRKPGTKRPNGIVSQLSLVLGDPGGSHPHEAQQTSHHTAEAAWRIRRRVVSVMLKPQTPGYLVHGRKARLPVFPWVHEARRPIKSR